MDIEKLDINQATQLEDDIAPLSLQLNDYKQSIDARIRILGNAKITIESILVRWEKTDEIAVQQKWIPALLERITTNLGEIKKIAQPLTKNYNELLQKQNELTNSLIYLSELESSIQRVREQFFSTVFTFTEPPIWQVLSNDPEHLSVGTRIKLGVKENLRVIMRFTEIYRKKIYYHVVFTAFLYFILLFTKKEVIKWSDEKKDSNIQSSLFIINHPLSATVLISILITRVFYPHISDEMMNYFFFLLIYPIISLIPGIFPSIPKKYFIFIAFGIIAFQFIELFSEMEVVDRLAMLVLSGLSLLFLGSFLYNRTALANETRQFNWLRSVFLIKMAIAVLIASIILNVLGNTSMAGILVDGAFTMVFGGLIIISALKVVRSLFSLVLQYSHISTMNIVLNHSAQVKANAFRLFNLTAWFFWIIRVLKSYMIFDPLYLWVSNILGRQWHLGSLNFTLGSILAFFIAIWVTILISRFIRFILQEEIFTHFQMGRGVPGAISMIIRLSLIVIGFVIALGAAKIDFSSITIIIGALGVGIGFGLQNIFNNLVSGLILVFERPIQVGDVIQISTLSITGEVKEIGFRASIIRSFDGAEVVVPNGNLISNDMINWTLSDNKRRQEIIVGVAYGSDTTKVLEILNDVVSHQPLILKNPPPFIIFTGFGDSSLNFKVLFWTLYDNGLASKSVVGIAIDNAFRKAGIEIPFPQRDLHIKTANKEVNIQDVPSPPLTKKAIKQTGRGD
ncbi:MAG: mechanosensitive ion channel [Cyclobacteriaceae bacterium]|nr:mechanosensitive ion channel [Cyclobacteriaceae bacterium]